MLSVVNKVAASVAMTLALLCPSLAAAEPKVKDVVEATGAERDYMLIYVMGLMRGISWMTVMSDGPPLYCQPEKLAIAPEQAIDMAKRYADETRQTRDDYFPAILILALKQVFPCSPPRQ